MAGLGLPVPPGMTISTEVCTYYYANNRNYPSELAQQVQKGLARVEKIIRRRFGDAKNPLLALGSFRCPSVYARHGLWTRC